MRLVDVHVGSLWRGKGGHAYIVHEVLRVTTTSVKFRPVQGRRHAGSRTWTQPIQAFIKSHERL